MKLAEASTELKLYPLVERRGCALRLENQEFCERTQANSHTEWELSEEQMLCYL